MSRYAIRIHLAALVLALLPMPLVAQAAAMASQSGQRPLTLADYDGWKRISSADISPDGRWVTYAYAPNEGDDTLFVKALDTNTIHTIPTGSQPSFSADSRWVAFRVNPNPGRAGRAGGARGQQPPGGRGGRGGRGGGGANTVLRLMDLGSSATEDITGVSSFSFTDNARWLVMTKPGPEGADYGGSDLVLRDMQTGTSRNIGNVSDYSFNEDETVLLYVVDAADQAGNGVYRLNLTDNRLTPISTGAFTFSNLTWSDDNASIAFFRGNTPEGKVYRATELVIVNGVAGNSPRTTSYDPATDTSFPDGMVLSNLGGLSWNDDGDRIFVGIKEQWDEIEPPEERANVDVWHYKDEDQQSVQEQRANQLRNFTYASVYNIGTQRLVQLADDQVMSVSEVPTGKWAIGQDTHPYAYEPAWGGARADFYKIDMDTGERTLIVDNMLRDLGTSPDGKTFIYFLNDRLIAYNLDTGAKVDFTDAAPVSFKDITDDHPYELPTYGLVGWTEDGGSIIMNHRYDIWEVPIDGTSKGRNLTANMGTQERIRFRIVNEGGGGGRGGRGGGGGGARTIDLSEQLTLDAYGDYTKKTGRFTLDVGSEPQPIYFEDMAISGPTKADSASRRIFTKQTFTMFPNYWVAEDETLANARQITDANPQIRNFAWSPGRVLIDYTDDRGNQLQGTLALPAGYQEGQRYPMLVYFYETMSEQHHSFHVPRYDDRPHMSTYTSNGYLVLQPDIVYEVGRPGTSAVDDLTAAVEKVIELGYADPDHIGLQGHSWGGYQSSFVLTQTDIFAAVVTGAPVTNLVSFYDELYKSSGNVQQGIVEAGQVRMGLGVTPWNSEALYESQSAVHNVENITTPFMILQGTADGSVDWHQGLEYFNAAQRNGKEVIFLSYPDEGHHLSNRANQKDFLTRMQQFFDHYLKDSPMPDWMENGVPFIMKDRASPMDGMPVVRTSDNSGSGGGR